MPRDDSSGGVGAWVRGVWRALVAEVVATALLVALGVASLLPAGAPLTHPALAFGFVVTANIEAFGATSGAHMNPAVTLAKLLHGGIGAAAAAAYLVAQAAGALLGFGALMALAPDGFSAGPAGATVPAVSPLAAVVVEALITGTLVLACCGVWAAHDAHNPDRAASIKLGLTVAGVVYAGGPLTGASLNPARSLAPALLQGVWKHHWVYWVGPLGGSALATLFHRYVLSPPSPAPRPASAPLPEELPLHDKP